MAETVIASVRVHGGNDLLGQPEIEFSSNANACGPCPTTVRAINQVDPSYYPESGYLTLRRQLANFHGVGMDRLVIAASGSEFITRITALTAVHGHGAVWLPPHAYADYATAASAYRLPRAAKPEDAALVWCCDPTSPLGQADGLLARAGQLQGTVVLDRAYEPLRLEGALPMEPAALDRVWQLWTPNKALGLPGIRAAYAIAPVGAKQQVQQMQQLAASWLLGTHGMAMLESWMTAETQAWVSESLNTLRQWKLQQVALCTSLGFVCLPSLANFFTARLPGADDPALLRKRIDRLRATSVKLRDATSFGLPGHARLSVQPPAAQAALRDAWEASA